MKYIIVQVEFGHALIVILMQVTKSDLSHVLSREALHPW